MTSSSTVFVYQTPILKRSRDDASLLPPPPPRKKKYCCCSTILVPAAPTNNENNSSTTPINEDILIPLLDQFDLEMTDKRTFPKMRPSITTINKKRRKQQRIILPSSGKENHRPVLVSRPSLLPSETLQNNFLPPCA